MWDTSLSPTDEFMIILAEKDLPPGIELNWPIWRTLNRRAHKQENVTHTYVNRNIEPHQTYATVDNIKQ